MIRTAVRTIYNHGNITGTFFQGNFVRHQHCQDNFKFCFTANSITGNASSTSSSNTSSTSWFSNAWLFGRRVHNGIGLFPNLSISLLLQFRFQLSDSCLPMLMVAFVLIWKSLDFIIHEGIVLSDWFYYIGSDLCMSFYIFLVKVHVLETSVQCLRYRLLEQALGFSSSFLVLN